MLQQTARFLFLFCLLSLLFAAPSALSFTGHPGIINYRAQDYNMHNQNWAVLLSPSGSMLFANNAGLNEFDGLNWSNYTTPFFTRITALSGDEKNGIHYGSDNDFGMISVNPVSNRYEFLSFGKTHPELVSNCGTIWSIFHLDGATYYCSPKSVFQLVNKQLRVIQAPDGSQLKKFFLLGREIVCRVDGIGLCKLAKNQFIPIPGGASFSDVGVDMIFQTSKTRYLLGTRSSGLFLVQSDTKFSTISLVPLHTNASELLKQKQLTCFLPLPDGTIACGTHAGGVVVVNKNGELIEIIDRNSGMQDNSVRKLALDQQGNLWAALDKGICMIELQYPIRKTDSKEGLEENLNTIEAIGNTLIIGTTKGLFGLNTQSDNPPYNIDEIFEDIYSFAQVPEKHGKRQRLFALTDRSLYSISLVNNKTVANFECENPGWNRLIFHPGTGKLIASGEHLLEILNPYLPGIPTDFRDSTARFLYAANLACNYTTGHLIISEKNRGLHLYQLVQGANGIELAYRHFLPMPDQRGIELPICEKNGFIYCGIENAILKLEISNHKIVRKKIIPMQVEGHLKGAASLFRLKNLGREGLFVFGDIEPEYRTNEMVNYALIIQDDVSTLDAIKVDDNLLKRLFQNQINDCVSLGSSFFLASNEGLIRLQKNIPGWKKYPFRVRLTGITLNSDSVIYRHDFRQEQNNADRATIDFDYAFSSLKFEFRTNFLSDTKELRYRTYLQGSDETWSKWTASPQREFSGLHEGDYVFYIQAILPNGTISNTIKQPIRVAAPWYRSSLAYAGYLGLLFLLINGSVRFNTRRLKAMNELLDKTVKSRTRELHLEKVNVEKKNIEITDSINYARVIQQSILPAKTTLVDTIGEMFLFYKPRDIVSGDFYWVYDGRNNPKLNHSVFVAVADCTGHGVPGAFMSMIGMEKLNQAIRELDVVNPSGILSFLNTEFTNTLKQHGSEFQSNDGMEISLVSFQKTNGTLFYSGANRPIWIYRSSGELEIVKPTKAGIAGFTPVDQRFEEHTIRVNLGDTIYLFTDGIPDQFGGPRGKKLTSKGLQHLLASMHLQPLADQKNRIHQHLDKWSSDTEQVDDMLMIGFRM